MDPKRKSLCFGQIIHPSGDFAQSFFQQMRALVDTGGTNVHRSGGKGTKNVMSGQ